MISLVPILLTVLSFLPQSLAGKFDLIQLTRLGKITPDGPFSIELSRKNAPFPPEFVESSYTFTFRVETPTADYPLVKITFPEIYSYLVQEREYQCTFTQNWVTISEPCIIESDARTFRFPNRAEDNTKFYQITGASASLKIEGIKNPLISSGFTTKPFKVTTVTRSGIVIDTNPAFGRITFSDPYGINF